MNIVLVHGILGFSHIDGPITPVDYFAGVAAHLRQRFRASIVAPALDPTAGVEVRSGQLRQELQVALLKGDLDPAQPIHVIAHSMGGLDARRLVSKNPAIDMGATKVPVKTLVTISTPHRGSPIADVIAKHVLAGQGLDSVLKHFRISLDGLHDLTSDAAGRFNKNNPDQHGVRYLSYAGRGRDFPLPPTSVFFLPYYGYIRLQNVMSKDSDGVVPVSSARWTGFDENLWPCDHADEIGHDLNLPLQSPSAEALDRFDRIAQRL